MTNPVTSNIGLNKIDRTSPSTTYFDLEKYIDQNADAVDQFAGETSDSINALEKRLDTEERREVVLQPGLQIVNAERSAPFKLSGVKGRTLVNLAGRKSYVSNNDPSIVTLNVAVNSIYNNTDTINVAIKNTNEGYIVYKQASNSHYSIGTGKYYMISADVKINSFSGAGQIKVGGTVEGATDADKTKIGVWQRVYHTIKVGSNNALNIIIGTCYAAGVFATANFDVKNISFYEISQEEDTIFRTLSPEQRNIKYPYVDSVQPVRNPYAIRYGENLAPTLFEGSVESSTKVLSEYSAIVKATGSTIVEYRSELIPALPNTKYTLRAKITLNGLEKYDGVYVDVLGYDEAGLYVLDTPGTSVSGTGTGTDIFATPANIKTMEVRIVAPQGATVGDYVIEDITLNLGATVKTHKPREDCILALQTDLYSDPVTGANADEVFEKDGQYFRLAKWSRRVLDGSINWVGSFPFTGFKSVRYPLTNVVVRSAIGVKYDGEILNEYGGIDAPDKVTVDNDNAYVWISNADSGWGNNYTPTVDEIKAYFMGWKMYDENVNNDGTSIYNGGTGSLKRWTPLDSYDSTRYHGMFNGSGVPTQRPNSTNATGYAVMRYVQSYQLVYQLTTPIIEPIVSEGMLTFNEGNNQVEVGTGLVVRENAPLLGVPGQAVAMGDMGNPSVYKIDKFIRSYKDGRPDPSWYASNLNPYGKEKARINWANFSEASIYTMTYLMLDKSPIVPFTGSYTANEKAMLQELTDAVKQNTTAVSVLMNKKADKDTLEWITPTLINGWIPYSTGAGFGYPSAQYMKDPQGFIYLRGLVKKGAPPQSVIFYLPAGYRPKENITFVTISFDDVSATEQMARIKISPDGAVTYMIGPVLSSAGDVSWVSLNLPPFTLQ